LREEFFNVGCPSHDRKEDRRLQGDCYNGSGVYTRPSYGGSGCADPKTLLFRKYELKDTGYTRGFGVDE
jgi:hypothetical protein